MKWQWWRFGAAWGHEVKKLKRANLKLYGVAFYNIFFGFAVALRKDGE